MRYLYILLISIFSFTISFSFAQQYLGSMGINYYDSVGVTASHLMDNGDFITASLENRINPSGGSGFPTQLSVGKMILRKLDASGTEVWSVAFPNSVARITEVEVYNQSKIIISGGYHDSLRFGPNDIYYAHPFRLNAFVAAYTIQGQFLWAYVTDASPDYSKFFYKFSIRNNLIYAPYNGIINASCRIQVLNLNGDSLNTISIADGPLFISEMEFDADGNMYLCGTTGGVINVGGSMLGTDSTFAYLTFIAKLDSTFQQSWSYTYKYITFDYYPQIAIGDHRVAFLVDTLPIPNGIGNHHLLVYYTPKGKYIGSDSVGGGIFSVMHRNIALESLNNEFYMIKIKGWDTLSLVKADSSFNYQEIADIKLNNFGSYPFFVKNLNELHLHLSFRDSIAIINDTDFVFNPMFTYLYYYQQMIVRVGDQNLNTALADNQMESFAILYPNPSSGGKANLKFSDLQEKVELMVFSIEGKKLYYKTIDPNEHSLILNLNLKQGVYIIQLQSSTSSQTWKWIVK